MSAAWILPGTGRGTAGRSPVVEGAQRRALATAGVLDATVGPLHHAASRRGPPPRSGEDFRLAFLLPFALLVACGEAAAPPAPKADALLQPGLYEVASEVTNIRAMDKGTPTPLLKQGQRATEQVCIVAPTRAGMPAPALAGLASPGCNTTSLMAPAGRLVGQLQCNPPRLGGEMAVSLNGAHGATDYRIDAEAATLLPTPGDITAAVRVTGRRVGDCPAEAAS